VGVQASLSSFQKKISKMSFSKKIREKNAVHRVSGESLVGQEAAEVSVDALNPDLTHDRGLNPMSQANDRCISIPRMAPSAVRFAVICHDEEDNIRRQDFDSILVAMHRFQLEVTTQGDGQWVELLMLVARR
jgi:hypothetical protein